MTGKKTKIAKKRPYTPDKMHVIDALDCICSFRGINHSDLADLCDISKQAMSLRFEWQRNISVGAAAQMAEAMGYEMALVPKDSDYPPMSYRIKPVLAEKHELGGRR